MKSFRIGELKSLMSLFQSYTDWQVQGVTTSNRQILIELYHREKHYLLFDLDPNGPLVLISEDPIHLKKKTSPMLLFLKKYLTGLRLDQVFLKNGRNLHFDFGDLELEARLFPHGQNLIAKTKEKQIAWLKPKELGENTYDEDPSQETAQKLMATKVEEYRNKKRPSEKRPTQKKKSTLEILSELESSLKDTSRMEKYQKEIKDVSEQRNVESIRDTYDLGERPWFEVLDLLKNKVQKERDKKERISKRIEELKRIERRKGEVKKSPSLESHRNLLLEEGKRAIIGKNAKDNHRLIRQAKPWFLWLHIRGAPSAHVVIEKGKNQEVSEKEIRETACWLVDNSSFFKNAKEGDYFEVQYTEVRHLRIPKGAKPGEVIVNREKVIGVDYKRN